VGAAHHVHLIRGGGLKKLFRLAAFLIICLFVSRTWGAGNLVTGSLSTPILYDSSAYGLPLEQRVPVANPPGGLIATAAWYDWGMRLDWSVTDNGNGTYTYHYYFGPGWYPTDNGTGGTGTGGGNPYVTNKNITALDLQIGATMTMSDVIDPQWNIYQFNGARVGSGNATSWTK
jgi:hypothetical protein